MQRTKKKPLSLNKEYLRLLNARDLSQARGGFLNNSSYYGCDESQCDCGSGGE